MKSKVAKVRGECDTLLQKKGRKLFQHCEVCGAPMHCLHHFFPKSVSARLRYDWNNLIPICHGCHMRHHRADDPKIHATIIERRGWEWYEKLKKVSTEKIKVNIGYYQEIKAGLLK